MNYPTPQRVWHRCGERDGLPDFSETLRRETAAAVQVQDFGDDTFLWMIQFSLADDHAATRCDCCGVGGSRPRHEMAARGFTVVCG